MKLVQILKQTGTAPIDFAASEIEAALRELGGTTRSLRSSQLGELGRGDTIFIGVLQESPWLDQALQDAAFVRPELEPEGYSIQVKDTAEGRWIAIIGCDPVGAMYGGLDAAEQIALQGSVQAVETKTEKPFLAFRGVDHPLLLQGRYPVSRVDPDAYAWARNLYYWKLYFDQMARNRFNAIVLMTPLDYIIVNQKYPEASGLSDEALQDNIQLITTIIGMARARGVDVYLMQWWDGWNINYSPEFAEAHGIYKPPLPDDARAPVVDTPLMKDYTKEKIAALLRTYPELTGLGCAAGERMPGLSVQPIANPGTRTEVQSEILIKDLWYNAQWIADTWVAAIKESGRTVSFLFRAWWTRPEVAQKVIAADYPGPMYIALKYNGEHTYSSPKPHYYNEAWLRQEPRDYKLTWELTIQSDVSNFRWGDPDFVSELVKNAAVDGAGLRMPTVERTYARRPQNVHTNLYAHHVNWDYAFQKHWFANMLWGRLSYNPETPKETWVKRFARRFGQGGERVYQALAQSSKVLPTTTCFHWNYMNGDWQPEMCVGGWNTAEHAWMGGGVGNYREWMWRSAPKKFHSVLEWVFNHTIERNWLSIPRYANRVASECDIADDEITPLQVADWLEGYADGALNDLEQARPGITSADGEFECLALDVQAAALLGRYYAEKTRGATELMLFLRTGDESHQAKSVAHLEKAAQWWNELSLVTSAHYKIGYALGSEGKWENYRRDVERDIRIPQQLGDHECPTW